MYYGNVILWYMVVSYMCPDPLPTLLQVYGELKHNNILGQKFPLNIRYMYQSVKLHHLFFAMRSIVVHGIII